MQKVPSWWIRFPVRVLVLLVLLAGAAALFFWSRADDPRFFLFLHSWSGRAMARVFGWYRVIGPDLVPERPELQWDASQLALRYRWEKELADEAPLHRLSLTNGVVIEGRLLAEYPAGITFQEAAGGGGLTQHIPRERVLKLDTLPRPAYRVSYRDIVFRESLPEFRFFKHAPFTVASEADEQEIQEPLDVLRRSYADWSVRFADLMERPPVRTDLQVVFCSRPRIYQAFRERYAPESDRAVGFYVLWLDRLFVMNFDSEDQRRRAEERIAELERQNRAAGTRSSWTDDDWAEWRSHLRARIRESARQETLDTIRHEGAHQFFYTTGIHSLFRAEGEWLVEGLAVWCETAEPGEPQADRVRAVLAAQGAHHMPTLEALVNARHFETLDATGDLAYALSWTLVDWLMQPAQRKAFFHYIRWQRDSANINEVAAGPAWDLLQRESGLSAAQIQAGWAEHLDTLAVRTSTR